MSSVVYSINDNQLWTEIAKRLSEEYGWDPEYWVAPPCHKELINQVFPESIYHSVYDAHRSIPVEEFSDAIRYPIDSDICDSYTPYKSNALKMMDRMDMMNSFTYNERIRNYNRILSYWLNVVTELAPDLTIFSDTPHNVGQYLLYAVCVENDIKTVMFASAPVPEFVFPRAQVQSISTELRDTYHRYVQDNVSPELSATSEEYLNSITSSGIAKQSSDGSSRFSNAKQILDKMSKIGRFPDYVRYLYSDKTVHRKPRNELPEEAAVLGYQDLIYKQQSNLAQKKLRNHYESLSQDAVHDRKYIYLPLHLQPERATNPTGGVYSNQYIVANLLSEYIPDDWQIYIKEHPLQFTPSNLGEQGRSPYDYDDFNNLDNVDLIDINASQTKLIDNATAVATVTGTAGWEALNRGVPAIVFGNASYQLCTGVYRVKNKADLESTISSIQEGVTINPVDVRRFVYAIETIGYRVPMYEFESINSERSKAIGRYVTSISEFVENYSEYS